MSNEPELRVARTYFVRGTCPKDWRFKNAIQNPPCSGQGLVVVLRGTKTSIVFSPFTLESWTVPNSGCCEIEYAKWFDDLVDMDFSKVAEAIKSAWLRLAVHQLPRDYDLAASILRRLGHEPPCETPAAVAVESGKKSKGGKDPERETRPMRRNSKRAQVAEFFMETASVREAMNKLELTRSGVLSHLHCIHKYNGFGYEVVGDAARLLVPDGHRLFDGEGA
jgi:hypothetical protein